MSTQRNFRRLARVCIAVRACFARTDVCYVGDVPTPAPVIYVANHRSFFDIPVGLEFFHRHGIAPQVAVHHRFFKNPIVGFVLRRVGAQPVGSGWGEQWLDAAAAELERGGAVALMPQGRITTTDDHRDGVAPMRSGVGRLAQMTGAPVVPIGVTGTNEIWPLGKAVPRLRLRRPTVRLSIGRTMEASRTSLDEFTAELATRIAELVEAN